jgi:hypothetical protein
MKSLNKMSAEQIIYDKKSDGGFITPFNLSIDAMQQLMLIPFEKDPDKYYNLFELQKASINDGETRLLLIAYKNDGAADVYYQKDYPLASQSYILNSASFFETDFNEIRFEVNLRNLKVVASFKDKYGRDIFVSVDEPGLEQKKPFTLLAPVGVISKEPQTLPIYYMYRMSFVRKSGSTIKILIDNVSHKPDDFQLPIDYSSNYFTRYSLDTFNADWNKNYKGTLEILSPKSNSITHSGILYELSHKKEHLEIKRMSAQRKQHNISIEFSPPLPDLLCLKNNVFTNGQFSIMSDRCAGYIKGDYQVKKEMGNVQIKIHPAGGWAPNEKRLIIRLMLKMVNVFKVWAKSYVWSALIKFDKSGNPYMESKWERI